MKNHVTSLELSKELNKLLPDKYKESKFCHWNDKISGYHNTGDTGIKLVENIGLENEETYPAYLSSELGEILPDKIKFEDVWFKLNSWKGGRAWYLDYISPETNLDLHCPVYDENECDARAKMLIFLIKNNSINL